MNRAEYQKFVREQHEALEVSAREGNLEKHDIVGDTVTMLLDPYITPEAKGVRTFLNKCGVTDVEGRLADDIYGG